MVDNEFGRDMIPGSLRETPSRRNRVNQSGNLPGLSSFVAGTAPTNQSDNVRGLNFVDARAACLVCSKQLTSGSAVNSKVSPMKRSGELCGVVEFVINV